MILRKTPFYFKKSDILHGYKAMFFPEILQWLFFMKKSVYLNDS